MTRPLLALLLISACTSEADRRVVRIGSKKFTESVLLGELGAQLLVQDGVDAVHRRELGGTRILWDALNKGELDAYPEYTGTLRQELLPALREAGPPAIFEALAQRGLKMTGSLGFEDTYAIGMTEARARALGISTLSDLSRHPEVRLGFSNEFMERADGWPALRRAYGLPQREVRGLDHDLAYRAVVSGELDGTDLYSTDAEIREYGLRVLVDDRHHFPEYQAVFLYRADLPERAIASLRRLEGRISQAEMIQLNARARLDRVPEALAAQEFLEQTFGIVSTARVRGRPGRILQRATEHLFLVASSLLAAIAVAIPLGILAARRPRVGKGVLGVAGVLQTIPSLALLVLMIPVLGIGAAPAIAALFLYSLLPIVRNTHSGLTGIPSEIRDSADALGLEPLARLRWVDLPMASRSILAGIKTAAVINVGTATLGALIGAGGFGQPILTGIRLADVGLILEGAVPAAALALLVQSGFDLLERLFVPAGLRVKP
jgi:osmoprotectant transport system permease protein